MERNCLRTSSVGGCKHQRRCPLSVSPFYNEYNNRRSVTFLKKRLRLRPGSNDLNQGTVESDDPEHQFPLQSITDLPRRLELDAAIRYVDALPDPYVPTYMDLSMRLDRRVTPCWDLAIVGHRLLQNEHQEFIHSNAPRRIERGAYGKVAIRW